MDARKKAAQATIDFFMKSNVKSVSKNSHSPYSDSDASSCEEQVVSNSNSPSPSSLKDFINGLPDVSQFSVRYKYVLLARPAKARR